MYIFIKNIAKKIYRRAKYFMVRYQIRNFNHTRLLRIVIGSAGISEKGWIVTEKDILDLLDPATWSGCMKENSIDALFAEHVWEHLTEKEGVTAAKTCYKFLKKNGYLRVAVPDGYHPDQNYIECVKPGGSGNGADDHKVLYNYHTLSRIFSVAGFEIILLEYFDETGEFHFTEWNEADGKVRRSSRYDERNKKNPLSYTSIVIDAVKV